VWCSTECKARDGAEILARHLGRPVTELAELGENDRSATGYLPRIEFEAVANRFFAHPDESIRGWERAIDAQRRIVGALEAILTASLSGEGDVAIIAHGGVGTLLLCHLRGDPIGRQHDQPSNNGGNYFAFDITMRRVHQGWTAIDA
jgi:broad specificity phosphatase PhoE